MMKALLRRWLVLLAAAFWPTPAGGSCPTRLRPCSCQERPRGLDIACERAGSTEIRNVLDQLDGRPLWFLRIRDSPLDSWPSSLLKGLDVRNLVVARGNLTSLEESSFRGHGGQLLSLDLSWNALLQVPTEALHELHRLVSLILSFNRIEILHAAAFRGMVSLLKLSLYGNRIKFVDDLAFVGIGGNLTRLNLGGNQLATAPPLRNLTVLQSLQLHENAIETLLAGEFRGIGETLDALNLARNRLRVLPPHAFAGLKELSSLYLEGNLLQEINAAVFQGLEGSLEWLRLGSNRMLEIPVSALRNLTKLRQLDLRNNNISRIPEDSFHPFGVNIKFLFLQRNGIEAIEAGAFDTLHAVEWLYLHSNRLRTLHYAALATVLDTLHVLDLHDNPFHCDCKIGWLCDWISEQRTAVMNLPKETRCHSPTAMHRVPLEEVVRDQLACISPAAGLKAVRLVIAIFFAITIGLQ